MLLGTIEPVDFPIGGGGSVSTVIMPFSGYMLTRPRRNVTLDLKAVHSCRPANACHISNLRDNTQRDSVHLSSDCSVFSGRGPP
jgi:hypothetical protein